LLSADTDTLWGRGNYIYEDGFKKDGFRNVELIKMPYTRITVPGAIWFERGIESLDKALVPEAEAAFTVASKLVRKGERARALDALEGACHPGIRAPAAEHACTLQAVLLRERDECLANARDVEARGDPLKALSLYMDLLTRYGPKYALGAVESLARLQARPEIRAKITAAEADRLKRRSEEKARAEEERRRRVPATALRLARNFINNGRNDLARKKLEDVVAKYPDTDEAREAKKLLGRIKGR
jgi:tetratricopeptide (TPR) repeat protein